MAIDALIQRLALAGAQQPGALDLSPAVSRWMGMIQAAQNTTAPVQAPAAADVAQPASARSMPETVPGTVRPHPVRNAILGLLGGGLPGVAAQVIGGEQHRAATERMQVIYSALPDEYKPLFAADPQGFLASYMKNIEPQKLGEGEMAVFGGPNGQRILNAKKLIDKESGRPTYLTEDGPVAFDSLGGDIKADNGLIYSTRTGVQGTYSTPQKLQMGETPGSFTPTVSGVGPAETPTATARQIVPAAAAKNMVGLKAPTGGVADLIRSRAAAAGLDDTDQATLVRIGQLESSLNPKVRNNGSSTGLFQFHPDTFAKLGGKNIADPVEQTDAAIRLYKNNRDALTVAGLPVTPTSLYLSHQQGIVGARALLEADPDARAIDALAPAYVGQYGQQKGMGLARQAIVRNGGSDKMTAGDFLAHWQDKVEGGQSPPPAVASADPGKAQVAPPPGWILGTPAGGEDQLLDDNAVALVGQQYLSLGPVALQNLGQGNAGIQNKNRIMNWVARTAAEAGTSNPELVARFAQNKANASALQSNTKLLTAVNGSLSTLDANLAFAQSLAAKGVGPTGVPLLDTPINKLRSAFGSVDAKTFDNLTTTTADEYARILTTASGTGGSATSDSARAEAHRLINSGMTLRQFIAAANAAKTEGANRRASIEAENGRLSDAISGKAATAARPDAAPPQATTPAMPKVGAVQQGYRFNGGDLPTLTPEQAAKLPSGSSFRTTDGRVLVRH